MPETHQERKRTKSKRRRAAEEGAAKNMRLVEQARQAGTLAEVDDATLARVRAAGKRDQPARKGSRKLPGTGKRRRESVTPEEPLVPILGRQQPIDRYEYKPSAADSGKRLPTRITSMVHGGLPGSGKRK
ncbi:hypothetical protein GCM10023114_57980 [Mycolicibacterium sediminis]|uniref:Uncharacterized protein n=1 Tax=Mycolicibacterium sediminis TaxID=1286180 RepID=A0A7I7QQJ5_9MYCO|nr:hypothetical protein MSEDJ_22120 [Mycolicibacterium sediminis]